MNFRKFTLKHVTLVTLAPAIIVWGIIVALTYSQIQYAGYAGIAAMAVMFLTSFALRKYHASFMKKAEEKLYDDCDPFPMAHELDLYLECANRRVDKTGLKITRAIMTSLTGEHEKAESELKDINLSSAPDSARAGVLYALASVYCAMNMREHAIDFYDRAKDLILSLPDAAQARIKFDGLTDAEVKCYKGFPEEGLRMLDALDADRKYKQVMKAFSHAKISYIAGDKPCAVEEFEWVAANGGRLFCAAESAEIAKTARERAAASAAE